MDKKVVLKEGTVMDINKILQNKEMLSDYVVAKKIVEQPISFLVKLLNDLSDQEILLLLEKTACQNINMQIFNTLFLRCSDEGKKKVLQNKDIYDKVFHIPVNRFKRSILEIVSIEVLLEIINSPFSVEYYDMIDSFMKKTDVNQFQYLIAHSAVKKIYQKQTIDHDYYDLYKEIIHHFHANDREADSFIQKVKNHKLEPLFLLKISNYKEWLLYAKFGVLVKVEEAVDDIVLEDGTIFKLNLINTIHEKHVNTLIAALKQKEKTSDHILLSVSLKLYLVFGFDNALKVIRDKFTYITDCAIQRLVDANFKEERNSYRVKNQTEFYYHGIEDETLTCLYNGKQDFFEKMDRLY